MTAILTVTLNPTVDKSTQVRQVMPEKKLRCHTADLHPGGGGLNVARAVKKLGGSAQALWTCGGHVGELLSDLLNEEQLLHEPVPIAGMTRENLIVFEEHSGQQFRFGMPGPLLSAAEQQSWLDRLHRLNPTPEFLVLSGSLPPGVSESFYAQMIEAAPASSRVILDASGEGLRQGLHQKVFLIKPNLVELEILAGSEIADEADIVNFCRQLITEGKTQAVVTSIGSGGAILVSADHCLRIQAPAVRIRSKVGAGDSTVAGIVLALQRGESLPAAVRFGVAAGAAAVMTEGTELCRREDTERLYRSMPAS